MAQQILRTEILVFFSVVHDQFHRRLGTGCQRLNAWQHTIIRGGAGAVMQHGRGRPGLRCRGTGLAGFQQGDERGHAHPAGDPHLLALLHALAVKAAVRPFNAHAVAHLQLLVQLLGVVAQGFDHQAQALCAIGRLATGPRSAGDGEGVVAFGPIKLHKHKLPGLVSWPIGRQGAQHLQRVLACVLAQQLHTVNACAVLAGLANFAQQRPQGRATAKSQQSPHQHAHGGRPQAQRHQRHRMEHGRQVQHGHDAVQFAPRFVRQQFLPEGEHNQRQQGVHGPLAHIFAQAAPIGGKAEYGIAGRFACTAKGGFEPIAQKFLEAPVVQRHGDGGGNPGPFVQAIDLIQTAYQPLLPRLAQGQQHDQTHHAHAPHPG